ncbi:J domain-containing protein [Bradyrhizobium sp. RD5-C2]|uniref:J domain-containing protein n=1 Tax=Bradyrhizobium sp. RD5-C2 TaxID=244562 RepID=UPI001CC43C40|nr:J domain-containing protein [Bradyrhizobium sp. RD5-C2]GIQ77101.1 hypothetical protein BraRD5C2_55490 [Bradyrhizobium sp. RD5-C2]
MARRKQESAGGLIFGVLLFAIYGLVAALPYVVTAAFYGAPLVLLFLFGKARTGPFPELENVADEKAGDIVNNLLLERTRWTDRIDEIQAHGKQEGVRWIMREDRFELRSKRGQELNSELESARAALDDVEAQISYAEEPQQARLLALQEGLLAWYRARAFLIAGAISIVAFIGASLYLEIEVFAGTASVNLPIWNLAPSLFRPSFAIASIAIWIAAPISLAFSLHLSRAAADRQFDIQCDGWVKRQSADASGDEEAEQAENETQETPNSPYKVLGVSDDASEAEVKTVYRNAIKKCHPDTVADRSPGIKAAAELETQRLNLAYEQIRSARGF